MTHIAYVNDSSETECTTRLTADEVENLLRSVESPVMRRFLAGVRESVYPFLAKEPFAFCMSENPDQLSQWRAYSERGAGFSVGFDTACFQNGTVSINRIIYDEGTQRAVIKDLFEALGGFVRNLEVPTKDEEAVVKFLAIWGGMEIGKWFSSFKDPAFTEEAEWRIMRLAGEDQIARELDFVIRGNDLVPYLTYEFGAKAQTKSPISKVVLGPTMDRHLEKTSLTALFLRSGYPIPEIVRSS